MNFAVLSLCGWFLFLGGSDSPSQVATPYDSIESCQHAAKMAAGNMYSHAQMGQTTYPFVCVPDNDAVKADPDFKPSTPSK